MRLRNRLGLVILGILIFIVATPLLVLYARGFKIDWKNRTIIKTGALVVKTEPTKATIFLNDEQLDSTTPANIRFLLPGDYNIRVEKNGYQSWTKRLSVKSQFVTWANIDRDFLTLFLNEPKPQHDWSITNASISRSQDEIIYLNPEQVGLINIAYGSDSTLVKSNNINLPFPAGMELEWNNATQIFNLFAAQASWNLTADQKSKIQHLEIDSGHIVALIDTDLYSLESGKLSLIDNNVANFTLTNDDIWYIQKNSLQHFNFSGNRQIILENLPPATQSRILRTDNQIYLILDNALYFINDKLEKIYSPVSNAVWDSNTHQLLYFNNNEIYLFNPATQDSGLILRSITQIQNPILNSETGYVFYQNEGKIKAIELDSRDHRNIFTIADAQTNFVISKDGKRLFTIGTNSIKSYEVR